MLSLGLSMSDGRQAHTGYFRGVDRRSWIEHSFRVGPGLLRVSDCNETVSWQSEVKREMIFSNFLFVLCRLKKKELRRKMGNLISNFHQWPPPRALPRRYVRRTRRLCTQPISAVRGCSTSCAGTGRSPHVAPRPRDLVTYLLPSFTCIPRLKCHPSSTPIQPHKGYAHLFD